MADGLSAEFRAYGNAVMPAMSEVVGWVVREFGWSMMGRKLGAWFRKMTPPQVEESIRLYQDGYSLGQISKIFNVTRQSIHALLSRRIQLRSNLRFGQDNHFFRGGVRSNADAHDIFESALRTGALEKVNVCEQCGFDGVASDGRSLVCGHHDDYNKPLSVRWLCQPCHHEWHKYNVAIEVAK